MARAEYGTSIPLAGMYCFGEVGPIEGEAASRFLQETFVTLWRNAGFRGYADYMETREFSEALDDLLSVASREPTAIMCAEAVPWRCHRSLISDAALARGVRVYHIMDAGADEHRLTSFGRIDASGRVHYDAAPQSELFGG